MPNAVAEFEQLALDPAVPSTLILPGNGLDADFWNPTGAGSDRRIGPVAPQAGRARPGSGYCPRRREKRGVELPRDVMNNV